MPDSVTLEYHLADLPTAQHKAGLAGLLLLIEDLRERGRDDLPNVELTAHSAQITLTKAQLQIVFDDWYDAAWEEEFRKSKSQKKAPKKVEAIEIHRDGKTIKEKRYVYDNTPPAGQVLQRWFPGGSKSPWLKLWRDMLWSVPRVKPTTRNEWKRRANREPTRVATELWPHLLRDVSGSKKSGAIPVKGTLFLGAQEKNEELVPFCVEARNVLLLHFWSIVSPIFAPNKIVAKKDGRSKQRVFRKESAGFLIVVPEVADLSVFTESISRYWKERPEGESSYRGWPSRCFIDVPEESAIRFMTDITQHRVRDEQETISSIASFDLFHAQQKGQNAKLLLVENIRLPHSLLQRYLQFSDAAANPIYKSLRITNLLDNRRWHDGASRYLDHYPAEFFVKPGSVPKIKPFGRDARLQFEQIEEQLKEDPMSAEEDDLIARRVYRLVGNYVRRRAEERKRRGGGEGEREAKEKVAFDTFLAIRGRSIDDFPNYFTGSLCSVPQFVGKEDEFLMLGNALTRDPERIRTLTMLALSAHAWAPKPKGDDTAGAQGAQS